MGMFDSIELYISCPYCKFIGGMEGQTKDLTNMLYSYQPLDLHGKFLRDDYKMRKGLPIFRQFPLDKSAAVWKNQAEHMRAMATVPVERRDLKFITMIIVCSKCHKYFYGKMKIINGMIMYPVYDFEIDKGKKQIVFNGKKIWVDKKVKIKGKKYWGE